MIDARESAWSESSHDCPRTIGPYLILRKLGVGGMGVVYAAYDEVLDRRLAIKVLHEHRRDLDGRRRERLLREAQALARVTHPNVVTVHEIGSERDRLFVVMEFVVGPTLDRWLAAEPRTWQQIVAIFRQIAEGVAAIHDAGLVHRDIKPSNVIVGEDGRVRVLDLGLVAMEVKRYDDADEASPARRRGEPLTLAGERVGTPAYMSREQFLGLEPTPSTDMFALCVAFYEALYGMHPFATGGFRQIRAAVLEGKIRQPIRANTVPVWLHALILRGLAAEPADRPASMRALSSELSIEPPRIRRRWIGSAMTGLGAALVGLMMIHTQVEPATPQCEGGQVAIAEVWNPEAAGSVRAAFVATERPYASTMADRTIESLDDYASDWAESHARVCQDHAQGSHSDALLDTRMACLDRRRDALAETVEILVAADAGVVEHAGEMIAGLPRLAACDRIGGLIYEDDAPPDSRIASLVVGLESRLVRAQALAHAGRITDATRIVREVAAEAEAIGQPRIVVEALLTEARISILQPDHSMLAGVLDRALELAIAEGLDELAAEAMIRRVYERGLLPAGSEAALADVPLADAMLIRAGDDPELRALLLNNTGAVHAAAGNREAARLSFARALALTERLFGDRHLDVAVGLANVGILTDDPIDRAASHERMIEIHEQRLGPDHPRTLDARLLAAFHTADPERAGAAFAQLCPRFIAIGEPRLAGECELERGRIEDARGRFDVAREAFERARERFDTGDRRILLDGYLSLGSHRPDAAIAGLRERIAEVERSGGGEWFVRIQQAERRWLLGRLLLQTGDPPAAVAELEQAIVDLDGIAEQAPTIERERLVAGARATLADALTTKPEPKGTQP